MFTSDEIGVIFMIILPVALVVATWVSVRQASTWPNKRVWPTFGGMFLATMMVGTLTALIFTTSGTEDVAYAAARSTVQTTSAELAEGGDVQEAVAAGEVEARSQKADEVVVHLLPDGVVFQLEYGRVLSCGWLQFTGEGRVLETDVWFNRRECMKSPPGPAQF